MFNTSRLTRQGYLESPQCSPCATFSCMFSPIFPQQANRSLLRARSIRGFLPPLPRSLLRPQPQLLFVAAFATSWYFLVASRMMTLSELLEKRRARNIQEMSSQYLAKHPMKTSRKSQKKKIQHQEQRTLQNVEAWTLPKTRGETWSDIIEQGFTDQGSTELCCSFQQMIKIGDHHYSILFTTPKHGRWLVPPAIRSHLRG